MPLTATEVQLFTKDRVRAFGPGAGINVMFKAFFMYMGQFKNTVGLVTAVLSNETVDRVIDGFPCKVWAIYLKKQATATAAFFKVFDDATDDSTAGDAKLAFGLLTTSEEQFWMNPAGWNLPTGLVVGSYTALIGSNGATPSTTGDGPNGLVLYGKP